MASSAWLVLWLAFIGCTPEDSYECGIRRGSTVTQCDGETEICVCGTGGRRCATYDPEQCKGKDLTGYKYIFGGEECVQKSESKVVRIADPQKADNALCPEVSKRPLQPESCGELDRFTGEVKTCSMGQCVCTAQGGVCALPAATCSGGFTAAGECLNRSVDDYILPIQGGLCPSLPTAAACGRPDDEGRMLRCGPKELCVCDGDGGQCARTVDSRECPSGLMFVGKDGYERCASDQDVARRTISRGLCNPSPSPPVARCATVEGDGHVARCLDAERCLCTPDGGACTWASDACLSGFEYVHDGSCVEFSESRYTVILPTTSRTCPKVAPRPPACGDNILSECEGATGCICGANERRCAQDTPGCDSGLSYLKSNQCVSAPLAESLKVDGTCQQPDGGSL